MLESIPRLRAENQLLLNDYVECISRHANINPFEAESKVACSG